MDYFDFINYWLGARDKDGKAILRGSSVRVYLALQLMESKYGYAPGDEMEFSWKEISSFSSITPRKIGVALQELSENKLIDYKKWEASIKGVRTMIKRISPVPGPEYLLKNLR